MFARAKIRVRLGHQGLSGLLTGKHVALKVESPGAPRRLAGQGDILAGVLAGLVAMGFAHLRSNPQNMIHTLTFASYIVRQSAFRAFTEHGRGVSVQDIIRKVPKAFSALFED